MWCKKCRQNIMTLFMTVTKFVQSKLCQLGWNYFIHYIELNLEANRWTSFNLLMAPKVGETGAIRPTLCQTGKKIGNYFINSKKCISFKILYFALSNFRRLINIYFIVLVLDNFEFKCTKFTNFNFVRQIGLSRGVHRRIWFSKKNKPGFEKIVVQ